MSSGIGLPSTGSRTPVPAVVTWPCRLVISVGSMRRWSQLTLGTTTVLPSCQLRKASGAVSTSVGMDRYSMTTRAAVNSGAAMMWLHAATLLWCRSAKLMFASTSRRCFRRSPLDGSDMTKTPDCKSTRSIFGKPTAEPWAFLLLVVRVLSFTFLARAQFVQSFADLRFVPVVGRLVIRLLHPQVILRHVPTGMVVSILIPLAVAKAF